jgi:uncharacterized surface protein with fasciclin (FAS1) repeats
VKAANLVETLSGDGPLLFLHRITLHLQNSSGNETLLKPESLDKLKSVLTYHVVSGKFDAATVIDATKITENTVLQLFKEEQSF